MHANSRKSPRSTWWRDRAFAVFITLALPMMAASTHAQNFSDWEPPTPLTAINTAFVDGCPFISKDGLSLYFASNRAGGANDIYVAHRSSLDSEWGTPVNVTAVNSTAADECPTLSIDGHLLFLVSRRAGGCGGSDIYVAFRKFTKDNLGWGTPQNLGCVINTTYDEVTPSHFEDDDTGAVYLYFHSNRPTGAGGPLGTNIFVSQQQANGTFGAADLVPGVNSNFNDQRPNIRRNGLELYFESDRGGGAGGSDLWVATRSTTSDFWGTPINLTVLNSAVMDGRPSISAHGETLYFMSSRAGTVDLYVTARQKSSQE
jgi:Tol biopolymer transport system component